jgi:hypothetical protein
MLRQCFEVATAQKTNELFVEKIHDSKPQALVLHLKLSDRTFTTGLDQLKTHLKIDVFFNGELSSCLFVPTNSMRSGAKELHQVFAGTRIDYRAERPWIILPHGVAADGTRKNVASESTAHQRWQQICQALQQEASQRGVDADGSAPPTAAYLQALATMHTPEQISGMQKPGGMLFGIIDLVISAGDGRKITSGAGYLKSPQRLVDETFPFVARSGIIANELVKADHGEVVSDSMEHSPKLNDVHTEADSEVDYEPPSKRPALALHESSMHHTLNAEYEPRFETAAGEARRRCFRPQRQNTQNASSLSGPADSIVGEASVPTQYDNTSLADSSPEQGRTYTGSRHVPDGEAWADALSTESHQGLSSQLSTSPAAGHTSWTWSTPFSLPPSDSRLGHVIDNDLMYPPLFQMRDVLQQSKQSDFTNNSSQRLFEHPTSTYYFPRSVRCTTSHEALTGTEPKMPTHMFPWTQSHPSRHASLPSDYCHIVPVNEVSYFPYDYHHSAPLPPTGLFTVPTKPKSSVFSRKEKSTTGPHKSRRSIRIKRLVINGRDGVVLVDHHWPTIQHVQKSNLGSQDVPSCRVSPAEAGAPRLIERTIAQSSLDQEVQNEVEGHVPTPTTPIDVNLPSSPVLPGDKRQAITRDSILEHGTLPSPNNVSMAKCQPAPQRRAALGHGILGVQGPRAAPFWLEDPEEILREAAKLRRSRSPTKRDGKPSTAPKLEVAAEAVGNTDMPEARTSSPLSSVPTTLESDRESFPTGEGQVQFDGSLERTISSVPICSSHAPSPARMMPAATSASPIEALFLPKSPPCPDTKRKRKALASRNLRQSRDRNRPRTTNNPPLNTDCVIAFAEGQDEHGNGISRQVRGERQGVFHEEYVVFAARFFIPGD